MIKIEYKSSITTGSLLVRESQIIARLLLDNIHGKDWHQAIQIDNLLQKRSPESAKRQALFVKERLTLMEPELWKLIDKGSSDVVVQAVLAASIKHSRLLGDFMDKVVKSHWQVFKKHLSDRDWQDYFDMCSQIDPKIQKWTESTKAKLKQIVFKILAEAKYVNNTRALELLPVSLTPEVKTYLLNNSENYVLKCMEVSP
ncbi:protein containing Protein of unknown function DUF1819, putative inner membrane [Candidatus Magnetomorum sp. HK-1]|nr:protein containing Protein of unknown function DUF1819, putative inner membrane [Candidatus Magnetomorum sp. HK-1]